MFTSLCFQLQLFNASSTDILEMLCDPDKLSRAVTLPFEFELVDMAELSKQFCNAGVAQQVKSGMDISSIVYEVCLF